MSLIPTFRSATSNIKNPEKWLQNWFGGGSVSESGVVIDSDTMMSESAVWCAVNFLASNIASLPCPVLKIEGRKKTKDKSNNLYKILNLIANDEMISMVYRETMIYHLLFWGVHYSIQVKNGLNRVVALWPVHPDNMRVDRKGKSLIYYVTMPDGQEKPYSRDKILHIPALGLNGLFGNSLIDYSKDSLGLMLAMRTYANLFFSNGSNMGVIFEHPGQLGEVAHKNLTSSLATAMAGLGKSHKAFVAEEGMKVHKMGAEPDKSQLVEGRQFSISDVARWFNLPPHVLKDLSRATYSNIEQQSLELVKYSIRVWLVRLEQSFEAWLLSATEQKTYIIRHNVEGLLRGDSAARTEYYKGQFNTAAITPNEIRELEERNPIEEDWADQTYIQMNMVSLEQLNEMNSEPKPEPVRQNNSVRNIEYRDINKTIAHRKRIQKKFAPLIRAAAQKLVNLETLKIKKESDKQSSKRSAADMEIWLNSFYADFGKYIDHDLSPLLRAYAELIQEAVAGEVGADVGVSDELTSEINSYIDGMKRQYIDSSRGQMLGELKIGLDAIDVRADEWHERRAKKVDEAQSHGVSNMVASFVIAGAGFSPTWRNVGKTCVFCQQMNGKKIKRYGDAFLKEGAIINGVVDGVERKMEVRTTKYPPLHGSCDCVISAR